MHSVSLLPPQGLASKPTHSAKQRTKGEEKKYDGREQKSSGEIDSFDEKYFAETLIHSAVSPLGA